MSALPISRHLAQSILHEYASASGNNFGDHYNQEAAIQWMQYALQKSGVAELMEADAEYDEAIDALCNSTRLNAEDRNAALDRRDAAVARRVAAMAACKGSIA